MLPFLFGGVILLLINICQCADLFQTDSESIIIQFLPELNADRFLTVYPSLRHKVEGNVTIGSFKAIYGKFDSRFVRLLSYSNLVSIFSCFSILSFLQSNDNT